MPLFLITFFTIYGSAHVYFFLKLRSATNFSAPAYAGIFLFLLLMVASPVLIRLLERWGAGSAARMLAYPAYVWMGLLFLFISWSLFFFSISLFFGVPLKWLGVFSRWRLPPAVSFSLPMMLSCLMLAYGFFEAQNLRVERITLSTPKLLPGVDDVKIVQVSDLHLGLLEREERLEEIVKIIEREAPDMIVSTGDLVDGQMYDIGELAAYFAALSPPLGKYAVLGNHEFYAGVENSLDFLRKCGFVVLTGETRRVTDYLTLVGVDDPAGERMGMAAGKKEADLLSAGSKAGFVVLLKHRPLWNRHLLGDFDIQLSGHTHKGQIFPFRYVTKIYYPEDAGLVQLGLGSYLYVSRGTGTWGPPVRILAPPEITVINVVNSRN